MTNEKMLELLNEKEYYKLEIGILENIRKEVEKSKGTKASDLTIIKRITEFEKKINNGRWNGYHPFIYDGIEYKGFTQGHYILASENDFGYPIAESPFKMENMFGSDLFYGIETKVDITELKLFLKTTNKKDRKPYVIEYTNSKGEAFKIGFNAQYLLDGLQFNKSDTIYISTPKAPAGIRNESIKTIALVLPVSLPKVE